MSALVLLVQGLVRAYLGSLDDAILIRCKWQDGKIVARG